jgi:hypothetical protein
MLTEFNFAINLEYDKSKIKSLGVLAQRLDKLPRQRNLFDEDLIGFEGERILVKNIRDLFDAL